MGGPTPYVPIDIYNDGDDVSGNHNAAAGIGLNPGVASGSGSGGAGLGGSSGAKRSANPVLNADQLHRARVLCAYDAKDHTELNLNANEVSRIYLHTKYRLYAINCVFNFVGNFRYRMLTSKSGLHVW